MKHKCRALSTRGGRQTVGVSAFPSRREGEQAPQPRSNRPQRAHARRSPASGSLRVHLAVAVMLAWCGAVAGQEPVTGLRAGAATSNITPPLGSIIVGGFNPFPAKHIHDDLHARCLVLDDGRTKLVFVLVDNVGIPREVYDAAKGMIHAETGVYVENMLMAATHTHSAASARGVHRLLPNYELTEYQEFIARRIVDGVQCALNNLEPARIGWGRAEEPSQVFNRR